MTSLQSSVRTLRELCAEFNIHTICALERALYLNDGLTQQEIADKTSHTKQSQGRWETWMELNGLIAITKNGHRRMTTYTASGEDFINKLTLLWQK